MHLLPLMRRPRSHSHRSSWPIFWLIFLQPSLSPGPCLPACRAVGPIHADPLPHTVILQSVVNRSVVILLQSVQSYKTVGGGKSHRVHCE